MKKIWSTTLVHFSLMMMILGDQEVTNFAALELNTNSLRGSRWSTEYQGNIEVYHSVEIVDISKVNVDTMSVRVEFHLRQRWEADSLVFPHGLFKDSDPPGTYVTTNSEVLKYVWSPDSYLPNARETKIAFVNNQQSMVKLYKNKTIVYTARLYSLLGCAFSFQWYPLDTQSCDLKFESFKLLQYDMKYPLHFSNGTSTRFGRSETYAYVLLKFTFERQLGHHIIQVFTPTTLVVVLSWFSFWLGLDAIPGRVTLLVTCMLSLVTMHTGLKGDLPPVNYIKMLDVWMVSCMGFVFSAITEFIAVRYIHHKSQQKKKDDNHEDVNKNTKHGIKTEASAGPYYLEMYPDSRNNEGTHESQIVKQRKWAGPVLHSAQEQPHRIFERRMSTAELSEKYHRRKRRKRRNVPLWEKIDNVSKALFPIVFLIFLGLYWPFLIFGAATATQ